MGMQTIWFAVALVFLILSVAGLVTAAVLCFCRQRAATPRHPHNAHNAQTHPPVSFPCESQKAHSFASTRGLHSPFSCRLLGRCSMCRLPPSCSTIRQSARPFHPLSPFFLGFFSLRRWDFFRELRSRIVEESSSKLCDDLPRNFPWFSGRIENASSRCQAFVYFLSYWE